MYLSGEFTFAPMDGSAPVSYSNAVAVITESPSIFVTGLYKSVVAFYSDEAKSTVIFSTDFFSENNTEESALTAAKRQYARNMVLIRE
ncbi:hypothetical protein [Klebsiella michiganensis]|uniref:hypothetical protein n=1 Tax=Klebsiella michiganensis TaxID=1134687 RepID=UPI0015601CAA|nr:hypothetical protein [Klebsiella michiganensis]NRG22246.1 hypothetical protein [Klebsiella michiganensis]HDT6048300.1 hypothetical protein [Klebsiella michiganensis]HDT6064683.1 hypothetical protein [Klebsiella michiganensis]